MADPLDSFPAFIDEVRARLEAGRREYGDRSFGAAPAALLGELEQEALDLAGWGFVLFERIRRLREHTELHIFTRESARVVPIVWRPSSPAGAAGRFEARPAVELPRLPVARELVELPASEAVLGAARFSGGGFVVQIVRHTPGAPDGTVADLYLVAEPLERAGRTLRDRLTATEVAEGADGA